MTGDLRDRIAALLEVDWTHRCLRINCAECVRRDLAERVLPVFAEVEANARAEVRERVEAVLSEHFAPSGAQWTEVRPETIRAALSDTTPAETAAQVRERVEAALAAHTVDWAGGVVGVRHLRAALGDTTPTEVRDG